MKIFSLLLLWVSMSIAVLADEPQCQIESANMAFEVVCDSEDSKVFFFHSKQSDGKYLYKSEAHEKESLVFDTVDLESGVYTNGKGKSQNFTL